MILKNNSCRTINQEIISCSISSTYYAPFFYWKNICLVYQLDKKNWPNKKICVFPITDRP